MKLKLNTKKIIFFLLAYYLCLAPILYLICHYTGTVKISDPFKFVLSIITPGLPLLTSAIYMEQIVFFLTFFLIANRMINTGKYLNSHSIYAFLFYFLFFLIINLYFFDVGLIYFSQYYGTATDLICKSFVFVLLGLNIHVIDDMFRIKKMRNLFYTLTACYVALLFSAIFFVTSKEVVSWYLRGISRDTVIENFAFDYLYISDTTALLFLLIMSQVKSMTRKLLIFFFGFFILSLTGSRTSLICFGLAGILFWVVISFNIRKTILSTVVLPVLFIASVFIYFTFTTEQSILQYGDGSINPSGSYRFLLSNYQTDGSYMERQIYFNQNWNALKDNWLFGDFMSDYKENRPGTYFHNWLSFWRAFGIVPFLLSVILIVSSLYRSVRQIRKDSDSPTNQMLFLWAIYIIIAITFSRSYDFYYIWFIFFGSSMIDRKFTWRGVHRHFTLLTGKKLRWGSQNIR